MRCHNRLSLLSDTESESLTKSVLCSSIRNGRLFRDFLTDATLKSTRAHPEISRESRDRWEASALIVLGVLPELRMPTN